MEQRLPSYKSPPLVETALSVQFKPISGFGNSLLGLFWSRIRRDFPNASDADPIEPQFERFGTGVMRQPWLPAFRIVSSQAAARLQMSSADAHAMIQIQNGRFVYNWRRMEDGRYPRWDAVFPAFKSALADFEAFIAAEGLGAVEPNQWEVTYLNRLLKGTDWEDRSALDRVLPGLLGSATRPPVGEMESFASNWRIELPDERGRLHIDLSHGMVGQDPSAPEVVSLQFTARGPISASGGQSLDEGLNFGRTVIVQTFDVVTGDEAHRLWGREP